jgi:predicted dehydrogenase
MKKFKIGIIGYGKMGNIRHDILKKLKNISVVVIYDKNNKSNNSLFVKNINQFLLHKLDAVIISTYTSENYKFTKFFLKKNIHVFCEKPPAQNFFELKKIRPIINKKNCILKYGFNHRYHSSIKFAKKLLNKKKFGKLLWIRGVYGKAGSIDYNKDWRNFKKFSGGGILLDQGIHMLDLILYFSNSKFRRIYSILTTSYWKIKPEDNAFILMKNNQGAICSMHSSATQWKHKFIFELYYENGYIELDGLLTSTKSYAPETIKYSLKNNIKKDKPKERTKRFTTDNSFKEEILEFIDCISFNKKPIHGTYNHAYNVMKILNNIYKGTKYKWKQ